MPELVLAKSFLEGQYYGFSALNNGTISTNNLPLCQHPEILGHFNDVLEFVNSKPKLNSITDSEEVEKLILLLDNFSKLNELEFDEKVTITASWTLLSQAIFTNEFLVDEYRGLLRNILSKLI